MAGRLLFIYNDPSAPEALLGEVFTEHGFDIDVLNVVPADRLDDPAVDVTFPDPTDYDVVVPLGSRWSVYDDALLSTWVGAEMQFIRDAQAAGVGVLGVCFGGQLIAQALGGSVSRSPSPELGWYEVSSTTPDLVSSGPWFAWHFDRWTLPPGAVEVARNSSASQAFTAGSALALQFHPELDDALLELWIDEDRDNEVERVGADVDRLRADTAAQRDAAAGRVRALVSGFLSRVGRPVAHARPS
ncbi:type 1 glutamine amidotransferase [Mycobacterium sp. ACS4331]|uniref:type 1 glutamine amidotransferase n=1 Tax=Mycobacterium sp. ACS4331 TaxID=1834121 RepID=UPI0007FC6DAB|nr:type 1 glutamine amidotransferase [Mycobacterium sp. ACS4331]OBF25211.1 glutamine amidotransferase [Mycobacterium sp. ACS4331]